MNNPNIEGMIIIGDSLSSDILGGINAGIHTCWYNPKRSENMTEIKPEYEIDSLDKIFDVLVSKEDMVIFEKIQDVTRSIARADLVIFLQCYVNHIPGFSVR